MIAPADEKFAERLNLARKICLASCRAGMCLERRECCGPGPRYGLDLRVAFMEATPLWFWA